MSVYQLVWIKLYMSVDQLVYVSEREKEREDGKCKCRVPCVKL